MRKKKLQSEEPTPLDHDARMRVELVTISESSGRCYPWTAAQVKKLMEVQNAR